MEPEMLNLIREFGVAGALVVAIRLWLYPALTRIGDGLLSYRAANDAHHAKTHAAISTGPAVCRAPSVGADPNGSGVRLPLAALLFALFLSGCVDVGDHMRELRDDLYQVRSLSAPVAGVSTASYNAAWDGLSTHADALVEETR